MSEGGDVVAREFRVSLHSLLGVALRLYEAHGVTAGARGADPAWAARRERLRGVGVWLKSMPDQIPIPVQIRQSALVMMELYLFLGAGEQTDEAALKDILACVVYQLDLETGEGAAGDIFVSMASEESAATVRARAVEIALACASAPAFSPSIGALDMMQNCATLPLALTYCSGARKAAREAVARQAVRLVPLTWCDAALVAHPPFVLALAVVRRAAAAVGGAGEWEPRVTEAMRRAAEGEAQARLERLWAGADACEARLAQLEAGEAGAPEE
jgi:hypothetical protein